jgi:NAD(P)-dependent dehydrogenase (short-subunit alcohol dehydrogenase family)
MRLEGKSAIVTGGGRGIGRAMAMRFAAEGASVVLTDLDVDHAESVVAEIVAAGGRALAVKADAAVADDAERTVREALAAFGRIDVLVNNAGLAQQHAEGTELERWDRGVDVTLSSAYRQSVAAVPHMRESGGAILNMSSIAGNRIGTSAPWYDAAKAGLVGLTRHLAVEHGRAGIRVNALCLGLIETRRTAFIHDDAAARAQWLAATALGTVGQPEEAAAAALFLVSDDSSLVTGQVLVADSGRTIL